MSPRQRIHCEANPVLVCHCNAVSERTIRQVVQSGARTCRQVGRVCDAGGTCGGCKPLIRQIIDTEHEDANVRSGELGVAAS